MMMLPDAARHPLFAALIALLALSACGGTSPEPTLLTEALNETSRPCHSLPEDPEVAFDAAKAACDGGAPNACRILADMLIEGEVERDYERAADLAETACLRHEHCGYPCSRAGRSSRSKGSIATSTAAERLTAEERCEAGDADSCHALIVHYSNAFDLSADPEALADLLEPLAERGCQAGDGDACYVASHLTLLWRREPDVERAAAWARRACHLKTSQCFRHAENLLTGRGTPADPEAGLALMRYLCVFRGPYCVYVTAHSPRGASHPLVRHKVTSALERCTSQGSCGSILASASKHYEVPPLQIGRAALQTCQKKPSKCYKYGWELKTGRAIPRDRAAARAVYAMLCEEENDVGACNAYATLLHWGLGGTRQTREAARLWALACDWGKPEACANWALTHPEAPERARQHKQRACRLGFLTSCHELGEPAPMERSLSINVENYTYWCRASEPEACFYAARFHALGVNTPVDPEQAAEFYDEACEGGVGEGCAELARAEAGAEPERARRHRERACALGVEAMCPTPLEAEETAPDPG